MGIIAGTGMNALELQANKQLTGGFKQSDLNRNSTLPFPDNSFDVVTCVVMATFEMCLPELPIYSFRANGVSRAYAPASALISQYPMLGCVRVLRVR